jgi:hypothetical protein
VNFGTVIQLPWWFPGAGFKKDADMWKRKVDRCREEPYEAVKKKQGSAFHRDVDDYRTLRKFNTRSNSHGKALPSTVYLGTIFCSIHESCVLRLPRSFSRYRQCKLDFSLDPFLVLSPFFSTVNAWPSIVRACHGSLPRGTKTLSRRD